MAVKTKGLSYEDALGQMKEVKSQIPEARQALRDFEKKNKLKRGEDHSGAEKVGKKWAGLMKTLSNLEADRDALKEYAKANKPQKERSVKYDYPDGATDKEKKAIRTNARTRANKLGISVDDYLADQAKYDKEYEALKAKAPKKEKKEKKEKPAKESKKKPAVKKKKKAKPAEEDED